MKKASQKILEQCHRKVCRDDSSSSSQLKHKIIKFGQRRCLHIKKPRLWIIDKIFNNEEKKVRYMEF